MTPHEFIAKWKPAELKERAACQEHFLDLCRMLGQKTPADADPKGTWFTFEYGVQKDIGGQGFADVWKKGCFGWEYKSVSDRVYGLIIHHRIDSPNLTESKT